MLLEDDFPASGNPAQISTGTEPGGLELRQQKRTRAKASPLPYLQREIDQHIGHHERSSCYSCWHLTKLSRKCLVLYSCMWISINTDYSLILIGTYFTCCCYYLIKLLDIFFEVLPNITENVPFYSACS